MENPFKAIGHFFEKLFSTPVFQAFAKASEDLLKSEAGKLAITAVTELEKSEITGEEKNAQAFANIKTAAITQGLEVKDSLVKLLIELALQYVRGTFNQ